MYCFVLGLVSGRGNKSLRFHPAQEWKHPFFLSQGLPTFCFQDMTPLGSPFLTAPLTKLRGAEELLVVVTGTACQRAPQRCDVTQVTEYLSWLGPFSGQSHTSQPSLVSNMNTEQRHLVLSG